MATLRRRAVLLAALVFFTGLVGLTTWVAFWNNGPGYDPDQTDCTSTDFRGAGVRMALKLETQNRNFPHLTRSLHVELPVAQALGPDLEQARSSVAFKSAVQCLLDSSGDYDSAASEWRNAGPTVTADGTNVVLDDTVGTDIAGPLAFSLGTVHIDQTSSSDWSISMSIPSVLQSAKWSEVTFEAPAGSLYGPDPWPPKVISDRTIAWSSHSPSPAPARYTAEFTKDERAHVALWSGVKPGNAVASVLFWFDFVFAPGLLLGALRRYGKRQSSGLVSDQLNEPLRFITPVILLGTAGMIIAAFQGLGPGSGDFWRIAYFVIAGVGLTLVGVAAFIWRVGMRKVLTLLVVGYVGLALAIFNNMTSFLSTEAPAGAVCWSIYLYALIALLSLGVFEAVLRLCRDSNSYYAKVWTTIAALLFAAAIAIERIKLDTSYYAHQEWLATAPLGANLLSSDLPGVTYVVLSELSWLVLIVPAFCIWRLARQLNEKVAESPAVLLVGGAMLAYTVMAWDVSWSGWTGPFAFIPAVAIWVVLRRRQYLRAGKDPRILETLRGTTIEELRNEVWARATAATKATNVAEPPRGSLLSAWRRFRLAAPKPNTGPSTEPDAVDVLLAVGPSRAPSVNAWLAMRMSLYVTVPAAAVVTWLYVHVNPITLPSLTDSFICNVLDSYCWALLQYSFGAAAIGLLWHYLPGRRGALKALPIALGYAIVPVIGYILPASLGGHTLKASIVDVFIFAAIAMGVGVAMDALSLRGRDGNWTPPGRMLFSAYGMQNFPAQMAFVLAQAGAIIAIWNFFHSHGAVGGVHDSGVSSGGGGSAPPPR